jgi:hypothetical protein
MKQMLAREEKGNPHLFPNLLHAMKPLMDETPPSGRAEGRGPRKNLTEMFLLTADR